MRNNLPIAAMIRYHRMMKGLSQKELAQQARTGKTVVFDIEKGKTTVQIDTLIKLLNALDIEIQFSSPLMNEFIYWKNKNSKGQNST